MSYKTAYLLLRINRKTGESYLGIYSEPNLSCATDPDDWEEIEIANAAGSTFDSARRRVSRIIRDSHQLRFKVPVARVILDEKKS